MDKKGGPGIENWFLITIACVGISCFFSSADNDQILGLCSSHNEAQLDAASMWVGVVPVIGMHVIPCVYALVLLYAWKALPDYSPVNVVFCAFMLEVLSFFVWVVGVLAWKGFLNRSNRVIDSNNEQCLRHMADRLGNWTHTLQPLFILDTVFFVIFCAGIIIDARRKGIKFIKL